jgi:hypothetical protein
MTYDLKYDMVFDLVKSMTKSEKRSFRIFVERLENGKNSKFVALFGAMDAADEYDEAKFLKKTDISKTQFANVKGYLQQQLLTSLRQGMTADCSEIELHEQLDFARVLYNKGMYRQSLKLLNKAKTQAQQTMQDTIALEIVEFEKLIEAQFITGSSAVQANKLTQETDILLGNIQKTNEYSNFAIQLYALYLKRGHARNLNDIHYMEDFYQKNCPKTDNTRRQPFYEQLYMNLANYWYNFIGQNFLQCYKHSQHNLTLFNQNSVMRNHLPVFYFKTYNHLLDSLFFLRHYQRYKEVLYELEQAIPLAEQSGINAKIFATSYYFTGTLNLHFFEGTFTEGLQVIPSMLWFLDTYKNKIDQYHTVLFYYKIACLYFGNGDYKRCITFLNNIINERDEDVRSDLQCFARILRLVATYEAGDTNLMEYQAKSTQRYLIKMDELNVLQKEMLNFLNRLDTFFRDDIIEKFRELYQRILPYESHPYEKRLFLYLDLVSWLESKIQGLNIQQIIQRKFQRILENSHKTTEP